MHKEKEEASALHMCCRLFVRQGTWFELDDLYGSYYAAARRGGVGPSRLDADTDADADADTDEEGEAREGGYLGEEE